MPKQKKKVQRAMAISWLTDGDAEMNKTVLVTDGEFSRLSKQKGFPHRIEAPNIADEDEAGELWDVDLPHPMNRDACTQAADCTLLVY